MDRPLKLAEYSSSTCEDCMYMTQRQAQLRFLRLGVAGPIGLFRLTDTAGRRHIVWCSVDETSQVHYLPVFVDELDTTDIEVAETPEPLKNMEMVYKDLRSYIVHRAKTGRTDLRLVTVYYHQALVTATAQAQGFKVTTVYPIRVVDLYSRQEFGICWEIAYTDKDEEGEDTESAMMLCVDMHEAERWRGIDLNRIDYEPLKVGETVCIRNTYYRVYKTEQGSFYFRKSLMQVANMRRKK